MLAVLTSSEFMPLETVPKEHFVKAHCACRPNAFLLMRTVVFESHKKAAC